MKGYPRPVVFGGAVSLSVVALLLMVTTSAPARWWWLVVAILTFGWALAGGRWAVRRYGRHGALALAGVALVLGGGAGLAYLRDEPNRRLVARIVQIPGCSAATRGGTFLTGPVDYVYIGPKATDGGVRQFTELDGLDGLKTLLVSNVRLSDETARRFGRFSQLTVLFLERTGVSEDTVVELERDLPGCNIEVR